MSDWSRITDWRNLPGVRKLRARPQANRLVDDFYVFEANAKQRLGSTGLHPDDPKITLEDYGRFESMSKVKEKMSEKFKEIREIRSDKSVKLIDQDQKVLSIQGEINDIVRDWKYEDGEHYRQRGIAYAASHLTGSAPDQLKPEDRDQYLALLKDVPRNEIVQALIKFGSEAVMVKSKGVEVPHQRWSNENIEERVSRLYEVMKK